MTDQHVVELEGVRLTRLPVGRAEGYVWLSFVGRGPGLSLSIDEPFGWRVGEHVLVSWPDGTPADVVSSGASGGDRLMFFDISVRDVGERSIVLDYLEGETGLGSEMVTLPDRV